MKDYSKIAKDCDEYADHFDGFIGELLNYACGAIKELQSRLESLEKDAARLDFLQTTNVDEEGLRYEVNCFVVDGKNQFTIYDEAKEGFISREWSSDFRNAIDTAMQANKGD